MTKSKQPNKGKPTKPSADALTKTKKSQIELTEKDLGRVSGGAAIKFGAVKDFKY